MKTVRRLAMAFCLCSFAFIPGFTMDLFAIDLTLNVPIELVNMPKSVTGGSVSCSAFAADRVHNVVSLEKKLGDGYFSFPIRLNYSGTAKIIIKNETPNPPSGLGYSCVLFVTDTSWPGDKTTTVNRPASDVLGRYAIDTSKPVKYKVEGIR